MNLTIILAAIAFIAFAYLRRHRISSDSSLIFLGQKNSGVLSLTLSLSASWIGAVSLLVLSGWVQKFGVNAIWYFLFSGIGLMILSITGVNVIRNKAGVALFDYFDNKKFKIVSGLFLTFLYTLILSAQFSGFAKLSTSLGFTYILGLLLCAIIVATYISIGGFKSVIDSDILQFALILIALVVLFTELPYTIKYPDFSMLKQPLDELPISLFLLFFTLGLMMFVAQENHQRIKAAKNAQTAKVSCFLAGVIMIIYAIAISILAYSIPKEQGSPILNVLAQLDPVPFILVSLGFMGAALSTADTALNISSYSLSEIIKPNNKKVYYLSIVSIATLSVLIAANTSSIGSIILVCVNLYSGIILPVIATAMIYQSRRVLNVVALICVSVISLGYLLAWPAPGLYSLAAGILAIGATYIRIKLASFNAGY